MVSLLSLRASCAYFLLASFHAGLQQIAQRTEIQVQIALFELEVLGQLAHAAVELHEGLPEPLDLLVGKRSGLHPPQRLTLHELPQQLDEREDELRQAFLDLLRIRVDAARECLRQMLELAGDPVQVALDVDELVRELTHDCASGTASPASATVARRPNSTQPRTRSRHRASCAACSRTAVASSPSSRNACPSWAGRIAPLRPASSSTTCACCSTASRETSADGGVDVRLNTSSRPSRERRSSGAPSRPRTGGSSSRPSTTP